MTAGGESQDGKDEWVGMIKNTERSRETMCEIMNKLNEKAAKEAVRNNQIRTALEMLHDGELSY